MKNAIFGRKAEKKIRILGLIQGDVNDPLSRSGVNFRLYDIYRNMPDKVAVTGVLDVEPKGLQRYWLGLRTFYPDKKEWARRFYENPTIFQARTYLAGRAMASIAEQYDIILQDGAMWMPGRRPSTKPLVTYHDSNVILGSSGGPYAQGSHYKGRLLQQAVALEKEVYDRAARVLTFSEWVRQSMIADFHLPEEKVRVARPGVNFTIPDKLEKTYEEPTILFVGKNFARKGGPVLLEAFRLVRREIKDAKLLIVGCSPQIQQEGVVVKGFIPREREQELKLLYRDAAVFCMPSLFEPFGLVFLEAMAYGLPCVGTNICAMPEIIGDHECGFVVPPNDHKELAQKLITLLKNRRLMRKMGKQGYKKVKTKYTWEGFAQTVLKNCREVAS